MNEPKPIEKADGDLIELAATGDPAAVREIVERHQAMVYGTCLRLLRNTADAEDAAQATFLVFLKKCRQLKRGTVLGGWLYHTAGFVSREFIRTSARGKRREEEASAMQALTIEENNQVWDELAPELDHALMALPEKHRNVVVLRYLEGRSTQEAAGILGMSHSAVTTCLARAIEKLRGRFQRRGIALSAAVLSAVLAQNAAAASVPATLGSSVLATVVKGAAMTAVSANVNLLVKSTLMKMTSLKIKLAVLASTLIISSTILAGIYLDSRQIDALNFTGKQTEQANALMSASRAEYLAVEKRHTKEIIHANNLVKFEIAAFPAELAALKSNFWRQFDQICTEPQRAVARRYIEPKNLFPFGEEQHQIEIFFDGKQYAVRNQTIYADKTLNGPAGFDTEEETWDVLTANWQRFWGDRKEDAGNSGNSRLGFSYISQEPALARENGQPVLAGNFIGTLQLQPDQVRRVNLILQKCHDEYLVIEKPHIGKIVTDADGTQHVEVTAFPDERESLIKKLWANLGSVLNQRQMRVMRAALALDEPSYATDFLPFGNFTYPVTFQPMVNHIQRVECRYSRGSFSSHINYEDMPIYGGDHKLVVRRGNSSSQYLRLLQQ